jgi:thiamine-monophosphate kinase
MTVQPEVAGLQIQELGEQQLLRRLHQFCPADLIGDDAAVLSLPVDRSLVVTTDVLVDGVHFSDRTTAPEDAGWRAAAANLSDLAAMGATPIGLTVGLALPGTLTVDWVERLYQGMTACLQPFQTPIVGGDVTRSPVTSVSITAFGAAAPNRILRRGAAQPGDALVVTGSHGASRAGLELLLHPEFGQHLPESDRRALVQAHQRPVPRLDVLEPLWQLWETLPQARAIAGMDSSDGLADAVLQICRASGVGARVERDQLPIPTALRAGIEPALALDWALYGGEDFELVLSLPAAIAPRLVQELGAGAAIVGTITAEPGVWLVSAAGAFLKQLSLEAGFQHFASP